MRSIGAFLIAALVVSGADSLLAQDKQVKPAVDKAAPANPILLLQKQVRLLQGQVKALQAQAGKNSQGLSQLTALVKAISDLAKVVAENKTDIASQDARVAANSKVLNANTNILKQIVVVDAKSGEAYLDVLGNMQKNPEIQDAFRQAVRFRLSLDNGSRREHGLYINGVLWRVPPGKSWAPVASGSVWVQHGHGPAIRLPEQNWKFDAKASAWIITHSFE